MFYIYLSTTAMEKHDVTIVSTQTALTATFSESADFGVVSESVSDTTSSSLSTSNTRTHETKASDNLGYELQNGLHYYSRQSDGSSNTIEY